MLMALASVARVHILIVFFPLRTKESRRVSNDDEHNDNAD